MWGIVRNALKALLPASALFLTACSANQGFSQDFGSLRVSGSLAENVFAQQTRTLRLNVTEIPSGRAIDASDVEVQAGRAPVIHAVRSDHGSYSAKIPYARHIRILVIAGGRTVTMELKQE